MFTFVLKWKLKASLMKIDKFNSLLVREVNKYNLLLEEWERTNVFNPIRIVSNQPQQPVAPPPMPPMQEQIDAKRQQVLDRLEKARQAKQNKKDKVLEL